MKKVLNWSEWSITTKILIPFLLLLIISMGAIGYMTNTNIRDLGSYALNSSSELGQRAIEDSTTHLNKLGEDIIKQKARDVAELKKNLSCRHLLSQQHYDRRQASL